jgi:D-threo-aldose 1-dehydrogenase
VPAAPAIRSKVQELRDVCDKFEVPLQAVALQFPLAHPAVASVLVGCRTADEVRENVAFLKVAVPGALWHELKRRSLVASDAPVPDDV